MLFLLDIAGPRPVWRTVYRHRPGDERGPGSLLRSSWRTIRPSPSTATGRPGAGRSGLEDVGRRVRVAGWVAAKRDHGGLLFVDLREPGGLAPGGLVQLVGHPGRPAFEVLSHLRVESVISVSGEVVARPPETVNPKLETGAVEVVVDDVEVLSAV